MLPHQVDCYTLLQENSTHTENFLRVVFSQATDSSPCVLLLRHLEALMYITQQLDPTQGAATSHYLLAN
jgi:peroxin-6